MNKKLSFGFIITILLVVCYVAFQKYQQIQENRFTAPRSQVSATYTFRVGKDAETDGVFGNLEYYGFVKSQDALLKALEQSDDTTPGNENSIQVGGNTIDREAEYKLSQNMDAWEIARILLNEGTHQSCDHGCPSSLFYPEVLPGGDPAPTLSEQYEWVKTFEDCVEAKGQLSSEQYSERTGEPRKCVSPDSREFTEGQEGWTEAKGG